MIEKPANKTMWDEKIEYLRTSREDMWNLDYLSFLVNHVWKIDKPVRIIDFGCGMGYLGAVLLPLLPKGSTYTGLDNSVKLLEQARITFANAEWSVEFFEQDLTQYTPVEKYDIAICQTVLIHIPSPVSILDKMVQSVIAGGRVICVEPNWAFTSFGVYRHGMDVYNYEDWGVHQKLFDIGLQRGGADRYVGIKIPALMHDLGLKNIDIRICDKANFKLKDMNKERPMKERTERRERLNNVEFYTSAGIDASDAKRHVENIIRTEDFENSHDGPLPIVSAMAWLISYGEK